MRCDVRVFYASEEFIVELKIWRGAAYESKGIEQLAGYLESLGQKTGWLISFCDLKKAPRESAVYELGGRVIKESIVAFRK